MQSNNRLGCLTGAGIFAAFITSAVLLTLGLTSGAAMFSSGGLNAQGGENLGGVTAHAQIAECSACHAEPWSNATMDERCAQCHQDIALQILDSTSLHFVVMRDDPSAACRNCHPEHRGAFAALTEFDAANFPHEALGFSLNGHRLNGLRLPFACKDCHQDGYEFSPAICDECHRQSDSAFMANHASQFGGECLACHDGVDRYGDDFSHAKFFPLDGKHVEADCASCHADARDVSHLQSTPADCFSCHQKDDAHRGAYGIACGVCHSPAAWTPAQFDHNLAAFKLEGRHVDVACASCHVNNVYKGTPQDCYSCHKQDDEHNGSFGTACESCHNAASWEGATFDHSLSAFKLDGAHVNVACEKCHVNNVYKGASAACVSCHAEPTAHLGQFGTECAACHTTAVWTPAQFNGEHTFPLNHGEGGTVSCKTCHPSSYGAYTCYGCHEHGEARIQGKHLEEGISNFQNCMECHPTGREHEGGEGGDD
ncbi:MAG: hypothetical protein HYZ23_02730 [Chloroflexi bacterium]|nr:hypothetical protein [Chloroflexota bacterium]